MSKAEALPEGLKPCDRTPVIIQGAEIDPSSAELEALHETLDRTGAVPAGVEIEVSFDEDCPLAVQAEIDRIREYVEAADHLGAGRLHIEVDATARDELVDDAIEVCRERATRAGVSILVSRE